jgi:hypothetical protein
VKSIAAGAFHSVALKTNGTVLAWGLNDSGQTTVPVAAQSGVMAIATGDNTTVALKNDGSVVVWGDNSTGQATVPAFAQSGVTAIASGNSHTVALLGNVVSLQVKPTGNDLVLSWPVGSFGFSLQTTPSLAPPVIWFEATNVPAAIGAQLTVTNPVSGSAQFYRLNRP